MNFQHFIIVREKKKSGLWVISQEIATQRSRAVDRAGLQAKMASIEF